MDCDWENIIAHVDMDAFFAQIEERDNPRLKGKPVIVGGLPGQRGVATTCNYEARKYGVHAGMPLNECQRLCPHAEFVRTRGGKYSYVSLQVLAVLKQFTDKVDMTSIDEAYLDMSQHRKRFKSVEAAGEAIRKAVKYKVGLTCSVGIAPNRYVAKLSTGENKPDGLTVFTIEEYRRVFALKKVSKLIGVGEATEKALNSLGIKTVGQLQNFPRKVLENRFGVYGPRLKDMANGEYEHSISIPYSIQPEDKSAGHETTFRKDCADSVRMISTLLHLSGKVARRLREKNYQARRVTVKIRYSDFSTLTHQTSLNYFTNDEEELFKEARKCFREAYKEGEPVRLIGVRASHLQKTADTYASYQTDLFLGPRSTKKHMVLKAADSIKDKYGEKALYYVGTMEKV